MTIVIKKPKEEIRDKRRESNEHSDLSKKNFHQEVNIIFSNFYQKQVEALYQEICR